MERVKIAVNSELLDLFYGWRRSSFFPARSEAPRQVHREEVDGHAKLH